MLCAALLYTGVGSDDAEILPEFYMKWWLYWAGLEQK
jgi:hypothetical protein